jgi:CII-binding regulator of phage lambda lysogenization HflD
MSEENLERLFSSMHILSNLYKYKCDDEVVSEKISKLISNIISFITHKKIRTQKEINELKVTINELLSEMIETIDPRIMVEYNIWEAQT